MWYIISIVTIVTASIIMTRMTRKLKQQVQKLSSENAELKAKLALTEGNLKLYAGYLDATRMTAEEDYSHLQTLLQDQKLLNQSLVKDLNAAHANLELVLENAAPLGTFDHIGVEVSRSGVQYIFQNEQTSSVTI